MGIDEVRRLNEAVLGDYRPDVVAVIDVDPELGIQRQSEADRIGSEGEAFQRAVRQAYEELASTDPKVILVDGSNPPNVIARAILEAVDP